jgi:hypothetical protein
MTAPAGRGLALQAEAERLFEEDDSEAPLSSDDDYTLAPDEVDEPLQARGGVPAAPPAEGEAPVAARDAPLGGTPGQDELEAIEEEEVDDQAVTVRHSSPPTGQPSLVGRAMPSDAQWFERMYQDALVPTGEGRPRLDEQRFASSLAEAGLEPQLQQELCSLAHQAEQEGRDRLFKELRISELIASTLSGAA